MTDRKQARERTERLRRRNELILGAVGEGIYGLDSEGRTTFVNPAAATMLGWESEEIIGQSQHDLIHHTKPDGSPYPREECPIYAAFKDGKVHNVSDEVFWRKDGSSFPVEYVSTPILEDGVLVGAVVGFRDITKRKRAEEALQDSEERYRGIFNASYDAIFLVDVDQDRILDANDAACRMLAYSRDELTALTMSDIHPDEMPKLREFATQVSQHGKWQTDELTCLARSGEFIPAELSATAIEFGGRTRMLVLAHDIRERRRTEARVRELQADLNHLSRLSAMGEMGSGLAHELNQPLTAIMNYLQACRRLLEAGDSRASDKVHEYMDKAVAQAGRAGEIIRGLRKFVEKRETERSVEDVNTVVEEASNLALVGAADKNIKSELNLCPGLPHVLIDKTQVQQVVFNLVRNSVEALERSERRELMIKTSRAGKDLVQVTVSDSGPGLPAEISERLFQRFVTTKPEGMGIGLSISRSIIDGHDGRLWATPNPDRGTTFHFTLPAAPPAEDGNGD